MEDTDEKQGETFEAVYKSFVERGPNKRKIKPVESQLVQFAFGEMDSDEDEDYTVPDTNSGDNSNDESDDNRSGAEDGSSDDEGSTVSSPAKQEKSALTIDDVLGAFHEPSSGINGPTRSATAAQVLYCGICLESTSTEEDEILECDHCGVSVHEGCYGKCKENDDAPDGSDDESDSTSSTVPWFCDACKANVNSPPCELCPSRGGIYKQCDTGRWVHLVCALYTPGTRFDDEDTLDNAMLHGVPSTQWGSKECSLCEDDRFCRTGVTVGCDAGMCRNHFHVTCAQKQGLLSEVPDAEDAGTDAADPLFVHCRLHADKTLQRTRRGRWLAFDNACSQFVVDDENDKGRMRNALMTARKEYHEYRLGLTPQKPTKFRSSRLLTSCPEACLKLLQKSELLGYAVQQAAAPRSRRYGPTAMPNLSVDFVKHFYNREMKLKQLSQLSGSKGKEAVQLLQHREKAVRQELGSLRKKYENEKEIASFLKSDLEKLHGNIEILSGKKMPCFSVWSLHQDGGMKASKGRHHDVEKLVKEVIRQCYACESQEEHHRMVECDTCHNYYHFTCQVPPLKRMPKKSPRFIWQCTDCDNTDDSADEEEVPSNSDSLSTPRQRQRPSVKPDKFTPDLTPTIKRKGTGTKQHYKRRSSTDSGEPKKKKPAKTQSPQKERYRGGRKKAPIVYDQCYACKKEDAVVNFSRCVVCSHCFHFRTCLDPPYKSNPQKRGYLWHCTNCDESSSDGDDSNVNNDAQEATVNDKAPMDETPVDEAPVDGQRVCSPSQSAKDATADEKDSAMQVTAESQGVSAPEVQSTANDQGPTPGLDSL